jgi:hypothetical protein
MENKKKKIGKSNATHTPYKNKKRGETHGNKVPTHT